MHDNGSLPEIKWKEMEANLEKAQSAFDLAQAMMQDNTLYNLNIHNFMKPFHHYMFLIANYMLIMLVPKQHNKSLNFHEPPLLHILYMNNIIVLIINMLMASYSMFNYTDMLKLFSTNYIYYMMYMFIHK